MDENHLLRVAARLSVALSLVVAFPAKGADDERLHQFENEVRPLLIEHCQGCHGASKQEAGLRLDSRAAMLTGGDTGPAIVEGDSAQSLLIQAVRYAGDLQMPPKGRLSDAQVAILTRWVDAGAAWPASAAPSESTTRTRAADHWAFQPVKDHAPPEVHDAAWPRTPVDSFVLAALESQGLSPSPEADRRTLLRRLSYTLTGLPPSAAEIEEFVNDADPRAYERWVERYLNSPQYGEQWARHWLDVARYSDTKGYVYAREERFWVHAWTYRDWVVRAFNDDMPYDRFLLLQLAADQIEERSPDDLAAMGFLTLGRRFLGVRRDIIDDRIDVVTRGTMGLSVACARCHDHKYDPIPTADYYSLYGVFDSCAERMEALPSSEPIEEAFQTELTTRQEKLQSVLQRRREETGERVRERVGEYLEAQLHLGDFPEEGFDQVIERSDLIPAFARRWEAYLRQAAQREDAIFLPWRAYLAIPAESFATEAANVTARLQAEDAERVNPLVLQAFQSPPDSMRQVAERYGELLKSIDERWQAALKQSTAGQSATPESFPDAAEESLRRLLYGPGAPCEVPDEPVVHTEYDFDSGTCNELWALQGEVDRWIINSPIEARYALTLVDRDVPREPRIFKRGNPTTQGDQIPRHFLSLLTNFDPQPFQTGSGRLEMARAIVDPTNPLTARVIVNRLWTSHFGEGLVPTPSDFGTRAPQPSHPELLDWLATRLVSEGWSLKAIQRLIVLSSTFRQASTGPENTEQLAKAVQIDPTNRLLWRMSPHRLTFEEFRDSMLAASGTLDLAAGGKPVKLFEAPFPARRTIYGLVDRQFLPGTLRMFDFANPDLHIPHRSETTVPQQALFVMNHPIALEQARALAGSVADAAAPEDRVRDLFRRAYQREPDEKQIAAALALVESAAPDAQNQQLMTAAQWSYGYGSIDEAAGKVGEFNPLPHFTGSAWQGGEKWPDATLGWAQLTAEGGHPGDDRQHATIRRWTAPRAMRLSIQSKVSHDPAEGDGIRTFIVSSRAGLLQAAKVHAQTSEWSLNSIEVEPGETIDFVVDIGDVLNSDQHQWSVTLTEAADAPDAVVWNSAADFSQKIVEQLSGWEQLAQVLLSSNEFLFVD